MLFAKMQTYFHPFLPCAPQKKEQKKNNQQKPTKEADQPLSDLS